MLHLYSGVLHKELVTCGQRGKNPHDAFGCSPIPVWILHPSKGLDELLAASPRYCIKNAAGISGCVNNITGALSALLAQAHIDRGEREGTRSP